MLIESVGWVREAGATNLNARHARRGGSPRSFWGGLAGGCAFVMVSLAARLAAGTPTLPDLVQDRLVLAMPGPLFSLLLDRFLYLGKPLLFGTLLGSLVLAGGVTGLAIHRWGHTVLFAAALWLIAGLAVLPAAGKGIFAERVSVAETLALACTAYALIFLLFAGRIAPLHIRRAGATPMPDEQSRSSGSSGLDRRRLLAGGAMGLATVLLTRKAIGTLPALPPRGGSVSGGTTRASGALDAVPGTVLAGLPPAITPTNRFYIVSKNLLDPDLDSGSWRLQVGGLVARSLTLRYADLLALPVVKEYRTLECISNEVGGDLISTGLWTGARLTDLLQQAGVKAGVAAVRFTSADGYTADMPIEQALDPSTLLAYQLNDGPLPHKHGYPVRVLGIATYGMKNPKWLTRIELLNAPSPGFWQHQGWDEQSIVQTMSQITAPHDGARLATGVVPVAGVAFAGARGISRVEVSANGGAIWDDAELLPALGANAWTFWQFAWTPGVTGLHALTVRATDGTGTVQTDRRSDPFPAGSTGYQQVHVRVSG